MASLEKEIQRLVPGKGLRKGAAEASVGVLQKYLAKYGFLVPSVPARATLLERAVFTLGHALETQLGQFDQNTDDALRRAQKFYGLPVTGELDEATTRLLQLPRYDHHPDVPQFVIAARWDHTDLTFKFVNGSNGNLPASQAQGAIRDAFQTWERNSRLRFREVAAGEPADCEVLWARADHGDGNAFDGPLGVLAHAFFPPPRGGSFPGDLHMDDDEAWSVNPSDSLAAGKIDVVTVAAHEIGHALGLDHSQDRDALMFPFYSGARRDSGNPSLARLGQDDIQGINAVYA